MYIAASKISLNGANIYIYIYSRSVLCHYTEESLSLLALIVGKVRGFIGAAKFLFDAFSLSPSGRSLKAVAPNK